MSSRPIPDDMLLRRLTEIHRCNGNLTQAATALGIPRTTLQGTVQAARRRGIAVSTKPKALFGLAGHPGRIDMQIDNGCVIVGSDAHIWPGTPTPAMQAFVATIKQLRPKIVVMNGDVFDGASISRFPSVGWEARPAVSEELGAVQKQLKEIHKAAGEAANFVWTTGNHDSRYSSKIANSIPQYSNVQGVQLKDHFPDWQMAWSLWINNEVIVKHRWHGGQNAVFNNALHAGKTMVTGHLHSLRISPITDYASTRWGIDTGCLATPYTEQFIHYTEGNPVNWRSGFAVLTFVNGELLWPELVYMIDESRYGFRGEVFKL